MHKHKTKKRKFHGNLGLVKALKATVTMKMASMQTSKSSQSNAASLRVTTNWNARTNSEIVGMVDPLRLEEKSIARILKQEPSKRSPAFCIQV